MITALSRGTDPETSHEAAASIANLRELEAMVFDARYRNAESDGVAAPGSVGQ
jgi:hypothetical protein